ncbi:programmed cell death protein 4-like [Quillaja saponaria]|uniref:Programmed cell death protein 4-like n=1 Tax=Quillaja saponaria TaxID=32244 RepID=A0AAD7PWN7_QUISA|nr:programmed cell death protein 4-like [Quillaja saponaria]
MKNTGKTQKANYGNRKSTEIRKDRKSATGMNGSPKKGGHGGKFTWIGDGYAPAEIGFDKEATDSRDPNFEDPEPEETVNV